MANHEIIPRHEWGAKPPKEPLSPMTLPDGWVIHYVGGPMQQDPTEAQSKAAVHNLQADAMSEEYIDIEYSFLVDLNGRIFEGRGWDYKSAANGSTNYNAHAWTACVLMGQGDGEPTDKNHLTEEACDALSWLTKEGARRKAAVSYVKDHRDVYATHCPGDELAAFSDALHRTLHAPYRDPKVDWDAITRLSRWLEALKTDPLKFDEADSGVKILKEILIKHGYHKISMENPYFYGNEVRKAVRDWKVDHGLANDDGKVAGWYFGWSAVTGKRK